MKIPGYQTYVIRWSGIFSWRDEFNRMIEECHAGNIDMVITKSISRFARNTLDCLKYIRELKDMNIPVFFEKESINTMDAKGEVLLTIMASLAQQESQILSQNVKLGLQYRYQQGQVQVNHNRFLGYAKDADGHLVIDPEQAERLCLYSYRFMGKERSIPGQADPLKRRVVRPLSHLIVRHGIQHFLRAKAGAFFLPCGNPFRTRDNSTTFQV